MKNKD